MNNMGLNKLSKEIHDNAVAKGFYDKPKEVGTLLMLAVSELSEALEADRKSRKAPEGARHLLEYQGRMFEELFEEGVKDTFEDEMADTIIRVLDMCGYLGIDIESHVEAKMRYNSTREAKHGKRY